MKLNIGCWNRVMDGWTNVDIQNIKGVMQAPAHKIPVEDRTCSIVYASHILEYYNYDEAINLVLPEWKRLLRPGGILRIAVPDFNAISRLYQAGLDIDYFLGPLYGKMDMQNQIETIYHKTCYDQKKLTQLLLDCGFIDPKLYDWGKTEHSHIDDHSQSYIPHMDKDKGVLISLNMEATKYGNF